jgi:hypothetical protein
VRVKRLELGTDQHVLVRSGAVGAPQKLAGCGVQCRKPPAHAELTATVPHQHLAVHDERRHRHGLAPIDVTEPRAPQLLARRSVHGEGLRIEGVEEHTSVRVGGAPIDDIAAGNTLRGGARLRIELPAQWGAGLIQRERVQGVRVRCDDIHRLVRHDRRGFVPAQRARGKRESDLQGRNVVGLDVVQRAEAGIGDISGRHRPL